VHGPDQTRTQIHSRLQQRRRSFGSFGLSCTVRLRCNPDELKPLTVAQLAAHPNLRNRDELGQTLKHFRKLLGNGTRRTFEHLMLDLSHYVHCALVYARGDEFYFDGRRPGGCGFNGGILPHTHDNSYGIHT